MIGDPSQPDSPDRQHSPDQSDQPDVGDPSASDDSWEAEKSRLLDSEFERDSNFESNSESSSNSNSNSNIEADNQPLPVDLFAPVGGEEILADPNASKPSPLRHGLPNLPTLEPLDVGPNPGPRPDSAARANRLNPFDVMPSTRQIMLPWCMWLLGSWAVSLWMESPAAAIRWMLYSSLFGLMLAWPTFRLSQDGQSRERRRDTSGDAKTDLSETRKVRPPRKMVLTPGLIFRDWLSMNLVFQSVVWPLRITAGWELEQALWIDAAVASWSLLVGALVAWGCRYRHNSGRAWATIIVFLVTFGEPLLLNGIALLNEKFGMAIPNWPMRLSPIETMYALTASSGLFEPGAWRFNVVAVAAAGLLAWMITLISWRGIHIHKPAVSRV